MKAIIILGERNEKLFNFLFNRKIKVIFSKEIKFFNFFKLNFFFSYNFSNLKKKLINLEKKNYSNKILIFFSINLIFNFEKKIKKKFYEEANNFLKKKGYEINKSKNKTFFFINSFPEKLFFYNFLIKNKENIYEVNYFNLKILNLIYKNGFFFLKLFNIEQHNENFFLNKTFFLDKSYFYVKKVEIKDYEISLNVFIAGNLKNILGKKLILSDKSFFLKSKFKLKFNLSKIGKVIFFSSFIKLLSIFEIFNINKIKFKKIFFGKIPKSEKILLNNNKIIVFTFNEKLKDLIFFDLNKKNFIFNNKKENKISSFKIIPGFIFKKTSPMIVGVEIIEGIIRSNEKIFLKNESGKILEIQKEKKILNSAKKGEKVSLKINLNFKNKYLEKIFFLKK